MAGRAASRLALVLLALAACGCSINPQLRVAEAMPGNAGTLLLGDVPFHPQVEYQCGPAALAGVLGASGMPVSPEALVPQVYLPGREGSLQVELVAATRRAGRIPYVVDPSPAALLSELADGRPVLVLQNLLTRSVPRWHYAVLVGADPVGNRLLLNIWQSLQIETRTTITMLVEGLDLVEIADSHQPIIDAIASGDAETAARVAREHQDYFERLPVPVR